MNADRIEVTRAADVSQSLSAAGIAWDGVEPELICTTCDAVLCNVEHGDTLDVLVSVFRNHFCGDAR